MGYPDQKAIGFSLFSEVTNPQVSNLKIYDLSKELD